MRKNLIKSLIISFIMWGIVLFTIIFTFKEQPSTSVYIISIISTAAVLMMTILTAIALNVLFDLLDREKETSKLYKELKQTRFIEGIYEKVEYIGKDNDENLKVIQQLITGTNNILVARLSSDNELVYVEVHFYGEYDYDDEVVAAMNAKAFVENFKFVEE